MPANLSSMPHRQPRWRRYALGPAQFEVLQPDPDEVLEASAGEPYWAEIWPSAEVLARALVEGRLSVAGLGVIDLGAGLGLTSLAAAWAGAQVLATDISEASLSFLAQSAARHGLSERILPRFYRWGDAWEGPFGLTAMGADLLYETSQHEPLLAALKQIRPRVCWLADPQRPASAKFFEKAREAGWRVVEGDPSRVALDGKPPSRVRIFALLADQ